MKLNEETPLYNLLDKIDEKIGEEIDYHGLEIVAEYDEESENIDYTVDMKEIYREKLYDGDFEGFEGSIGFGIKDGNAEALIEETLETKFPESSIKLNGNVLQDSGSEEYRSFNF